MYVIPFLLHNACVTSDLVGFGARLLMAGLFHRGEADLFYDRACSHGMP